MADRLEELRIMHRLFAALPVPEDLRTRLHALKGDVPGARWRRDDQLHVTLHFFGEVRTEVAEEIAHALDSISAPALQVELRGVGWFGRREPYSLHARIAETEPLRALASDCKRIARRLGLKIGPEPFIPHVTLAYCHDTPLDAARRWSEDFQVLRSEPFWIDHFDLVETFKGRNGGKSRYVAQATYQLG